MPETVRRIIRLLKQSPIFANASQEVLDSLARQMELLEVPGGETLIKEGDVGDCLYLLSHGRMIVYLGGKTIGEIGVGDVVGELALLVDTPRTATVRAVRDCTLIKISRELFETIVKEHPESAMKMVSACVTRLLPGHSEKKQHIRTLAIIPCQDAVDTLQVTETLNEALKRYVETHVLASGNSDAKQLLTKTAAEQHELLNEIEQEHDITLYVADHDLTDWTKLCIRHADKIVLVSLANSVINSEVEQYVQEQENIIAEKVLLVHHKNYIKLPQDTQELIANNPCDMHFHISKAKDYERVARFLLGRAVCVVFSGGGMRGVAHHGIIRAFEERNIPIDMVGGTSFGALMGMGCAMGLNSQEMYDMWARLVKKISKVVDFTLPVTAISAGKVLHELLVEAFPNDIDVEDMWLPAFTIATNLSDFDLHMIRTGPAWRAIRSSLSIPGIFPPMVDRGRLLVDGAAFNNLPVDMMKSVNNDGIVIASIASSTPDKQEFVGFDHSISGWRILLGGFAGNKRTVLPNIAEVLVQSSLAASTRHQLQMQSLADYTLDLGVDEYKLLDTKNWQAIMQKGYESACRFIDENNITPEGLVI